MRRILYETLAALGQNADFPRVQTLGVGIGKLIWNVVPSRRKLAVAAISERLGLDAPQATALARSSFQHNGRSFLEIFLSRKVDWRFVRDRLLVDDPAHMQRTFNLLRDRACVITSAHMGGWEMLAGLLHLLAPQQHCQVVVKATHDRDLYALIKRLRGHSTVHIVEHEQAVQKVLRNLRKPGTSAFLVDHNCRREEAVFLPFLGRMAAVNVGPALLALRGKALVMPVFLLREDPDRYRLIYQEPLDAGQLPGDRHEKIHTLASFYTKAVERVVLQYPEQWFWMHRRWKTRPGEELAG
ncbi:KDO2-lipid IV(A) lauroyltransferase [Desulfonatronum thiosulfatophilum]|uniref:KDO2-lipid IV(A) lauroyltransferase n=1 Tax=Desulfonatronum thiosulfatophilum TaxID=617002 RepID=A0A1G6CI82_9BACT|nr:lysophospholipid acyltransferase family protein [Desulfonatronum thiosulfatophilum]SDB32574.1 KDO2-lipid IV(A) lauroyltransferase [Desulfonatronum thiosulfatophilum]